MLAARDTMQLGFDQDNQPGKGEGLAAVTVKLDQLEKAAKINPRAYIRPMDIVRLEIVVQPADVTDELDYVEETKMFAGMIVVAAGSQIFTANGYNASNEIVAQGSANAEIIANQTASVSIELIDITGDLPDPNYGPIILSMTLSNNNPRVGETIDVSVTAQDPDGDTLTYLWEHDCSDAAFDDPTAASTTWSSQAEEACTLTVTVTAGGLSDSEDMDVVVFPNSNETGAAQVTAEYYPNPMIYRYYIEPDGDSTRLCDYDYDLYSWLLGYGWVDPPEQVRSEYDGTCDQEFALDTSYEIVVRVAGNFNDYEATVEIEDDCGGMFYNQSDYSTSCDWPYGTCNKRINWDWLSPSTPAVCTLTATLTAYELQDTLSFVIPVGYSD